MNDREIAAVFVSGVVGRLLAEGVLAGTSRGGLSPAGVAAFDQLEAEGFIPGRGDVEAVVRSFRKNGFLKTCDRCAAKLVEVVVNWDKAREALDPERRESDEETDDDSKDG